MLLRPGKDGRLGEPRRAGDRRSHRPACRSRRGSRRRGRSTAATRSGSIATRSSSGAATARTPPASSSSQAAFPDAEVLSYDLPHWNGRAEVMHLMSLISPLDDDLALVYPRLAPVRLLELLRERGIEIVEVPDEEFETMGPNVLALGPRLALALEGNDETRRRMEAAGRRGAHLQGRRDLPQGRRRPDVPDAGRVLTRMSAVRGDRRRRRGRAPRRARPRPGARERAERGGLSPVLLRALQRQARTSSSRLLDANPPLDVFDAAAVGRTRGLEELLDAEPELATRLVGRRLHARSTSPRSSARRTRRGSCSSAAPRSKSSPATRPSVVTPLHSAAAGAHSAIVKLLLEARRRPERAPRTAASRRSHSAASRTTTARAPRRCSRRELPLVQRELAVVGEA